MSSSSQGGAGEPKKAGGEKRGHPNPSSDLDDDNAVDESVDGDVSTDPKSDQPKKKKRKQAASSSAKASAVESSDDEEDEDDEDDEDDEAPSTTAATMGTTTAVNENSSLSIVHIDVGQGESTLIVYREGEVVKYSALIDGGRKNNCQRIVATLAKYNVRKLNHVISTHFDADHIEGLTALLSLRKKAADSGGPRPRLHLKPDGKVFFRGVPNTGGEDDIYAKFRTAANTVLKAAPGICGEGDEAYEAADFVKTPVKFECLYRSDTKSIGNTDDSENNAGIIMALTYGEFRYFTAGDQGHKNEQAYAPENCSAFKCGHHGSKHSTSKALLDHMKPAVAIISAARHKYRHPHHEVLEILRESPHVKRVFLTNCVYNRPQVNTTYLPTEIALAKAYLAPLHPGYINIETVTRHLDEGNYRRYLRFLNSSFASIDAKNTKDVKAKKVLAGAITAAEILQTESNRPAASSNQGAAAASSSSSSSSAAHASLPGGFSAHVAGSKKNLGNIEIYVDSTHYSVGYRDAGDNVKWCHFKVDTNEVVGTIAGWDRSVPTVPRPSPRNYVAPFSEFSGYSAQEKQTPCWADGCEEPGLSLSLGSEGCNMRGCALHKTELKDGCEKIPCVCKGEADPEEDDDDEEDDEDAYDPDDDDDE